MTNELLNRQTELLYMGKLLALQVLLAHHMFPTTSVAPNCPVSLDALMHQLSKGEDKNLIQQELPHLTPDEQSVVYNGFRTTMGLFEGMANR